MGYGSVGVVTSATPHRYTPVELVPIRWFVWHGSYPLAWNHPEYLTRLSPVAATMEILGC